MSAGVHARRRRRRARALATAVGAAGIGAALVAGGASAATGDIELVSRSATGAPAAKTSGGAGISADGNRVVFVSQDLTLGPIPESGAPTYAWVRDVSNAATIYADPAITAAISANGRFVAVSGFSDRNGYSRRDLLTGTSAPIDDWNKDERGGRPALSADGSRVLVAKPSDAVTAPAGFYLRDFSAGTFPRVQPEPGSPAIAASALSLSADGRLAVFDSDSTLAGDAPGVTDVFVRDLVTNATTLVSRGPAGPGDGDSFDGAISADGRYVAFSSDATNLSVEDDDEVRNTFVRDLATGTTTLVSRATGAAGTPTNLDAEFPAISGDGRYVSFVSRSIRLHAGPPNGVIHLYVRDTRTGATTLVDRAPGGAVGNGDAAFSALSADGRYIAFESSANNLVTGAFQGSVYRADLGAPAPAPGGGVVVPGVTGAGGQGAAGFRCAGLAATRVGTPGRDVIRGTAKRDVIVALGGADRVTGAGGDDVICLGAGDDVADGGPGKDRVFGGPGKDTLKGGPGADRLEGGVGADKLAGGAGLDVLVGGAGADKLTGGAGRDVLRGGAGRNALTQ